MAKTKNTHMPSRFMYVNFLVHSCATKKCKTAIASIHARIGKPRHPIVLYHVSSFMTLSTHISWLAWRFLDWLLFFMFVCPWRISPWSGFSFIGFSWAWFAVVSRRPSALIGSPFVSSVYAGVSSIAGMESGKVGQVDFYDAGCRVVVPHLSSQTMRLETWRVNLVMTRNDAIPPVLLFILLHYSNWRGHTCQALSTMET